MSAAHHILLVLLVAWPTADTTSATAVQSNTVTAEGMAVFQDFMVTFNRSYGNPKELQRRYQIFQKNMEVAKWLQETDVGTAQYGVTQFSDLTDEEFLGRGQVPNTMPAHPVWKKVNMTFAARPQNSCDWRKNKIVSDIRNQGRKCRACWAFASASNIEYLWAFLGESRKVSVQEMIDCAACKSSNGCDGGWVWDAFLTVLHLRGLSSEKDYPYVERKDKCKRKDNRVAWIFDFAMLEKNEISMADYVAKKGPITVTINQELLKLYKGGIVKPKSTQHQCSPDSVDHSVLLVGYGVAKEGNETYWILQNSWGEKWGEKGYFRLHRGSNVCGITKYPVTAIVDSRKAIHCPPADPA